MSITVLAKLTAQPGKRDDLVAAMAPMIEQVAAEPGTLVYEVSTDGTDDTVVWVYEKYTDQEALQAHSTSETMKAMGMAMRDIAAGRPELYFLTQVAAKG